MPPALSSSIRNPDAALIVRFSGGEQRRELVGQLRVVPTRVERQLAVGADVCAPLRLRQVIEHDHRNFGERQLHRGREPAMAGDDALRAVDYDW